ncbi:MAG: hypothetical protein M5U16_11920 [Hyphomicrobium sp.]|nr:hypothetical protein [Hyphomicrobium sp.]
MRFMPAALAAAAVLVPGLAQAADYAPMSCAKAESAADKTVCGNYPLGQLEARMATLYAVATSLVAMGQRGDMLGAQRDFLQERENCGADVGCLTAKYDARIADLDGAIAAIAARGA